MGAANNSVRPAQDRCKGGVRYAAYTKFEEVPWDEFREVEPNMVLSVKEVRFPPRGPTMCRTMSKHLLGRFISQTVCKSQEAEITQMSLNDAQGR